MSNTVVSIFPDDIMQTAMTKFASTFVWDQCIYKYSTFSAKMVVFHKTTALH